VTAAGDFEGIVVAGSVDVEMRLDTEHAALVVAEAAEMPQRLDHTVVVAVAGPSS
jgi:hypothetical protein